MSEIPLADLAAQHARVAREVIAEITRLMEQSHFILGDEVAAFEESFAAFCGSRHCVGVANGTDALELALRAARVGPGDAVLVPVNTFAATAMAVLRAGATPVFCDCDEETLLLDVEDAAGRMGKATRAIIPVHLFGQMAPMETVTALAASAGLTVVEDAAQASGATRVGAPPGRGSRAACYSFYPSKNLGAYGDAGAVTTDDEDLATQVRALRNYGSDRKYEHPQPGFNSRMDAIQAAVLAVKLSRLAAWNDERREAARRYAELLADVEQVRLPVTLAGNEHIWHLFVIRVPRRDAVLRSMREQGVGASIHYPSPLHLEGAFRTLGYEPGNFPVAERAAAEILSLPMYPEISATQQERVVQALKKALS